MLKSNRAETFTIIIIAIIILVIIIFAGYYYYLNQQKINTNHENKNNIGNPADNQRVPPSPTDNVPLSNAKTYNVEIKNFAFSQSNLVIKKGDTVIWTNFDSSPHTVTTEDNKLDSGSILQGKTFSHTFDETGTYDYICTFHSTMKGKVVVE